MLNKYNECSGFEDKERMVEFFAILISCFALVLILFCSQHGYIFLAGAGSATPDEVKSGRHTEYRLIKYGISTLCQERTRIIKRVHLAECRYPPANKTLLLPFFLYCCSVSGSRERSRVLIDVYRIYTTGMSFMLPDEFQFVFLCGKDGILCLGSRPLPTKQ